MPGLAANLGVEHHPQGHQPLVKPFLSGAMAVVAEVPFASHCTLWHPLVCLKKSLLSIGHGLHTIQPQLPSTYSDLHLNTFKLTTQQKSEVSSSFLSK